MSVNSIERENVCVYSIERKSVGVFELLTISYTLQAHPT